MKVDFMIIGAQKSGTTSLAHYLSEHPSVCFSQEKEPEFFSNELNWRNKVKAYHKLFKTEARSTLGRSINKLQYDRRLSWYSRKNS